MLPRCDERVRNAYRVVFFAVLHLVCSLAAFVHVSSEQHEWCSVHGRLEHVGSTFVAARGAASSAPIARAPASEEGVEHDVCSISEACLPQSAPGPMPGLVHAECGFVRRSACTEERVAVLHRLYGLAPKHSPPCGPTSI
ncbi:MAG: hypothetical protein U1F29_17600 [Planctomycetota bacterium]